MKTFKNDRGQTAEDVLEQKVQQSLAHVAKYPDTLNQHQNEVRLYAQCLTDMGLVNWTMVNDIVRDAWDRMGLAADSYYIKHPK